MSYRIQFDAIPWESPMPGVRHKIHRVGDRVLRLVEYAHHMTPHWCPKGHVGHIVQGRMSIEFKNGTEQLSSGDAIFIPPGEEHSHRATPITSVVTALFVEDVPVTTS